MMISHPDILIQADDHVIMFLSEKDRIHEVERLFQVSATFI